MHRYINFYIERIKDPDIRHWIRQKNSGDTSPKQNSIHPPRNALIFGKKVVYLIIGKRKVILLPCRARQDLENSWTNIIVMGAETPLTVRC